MQEDDWSRDKAEFAALPADSPHPANAWEPSPLTRQFAQLTGALLSTTSVAGVLEQITEATFALLPDSDVVSVTLRSADGHLHTPVETDPVGAELDALQYRYQQGPCFDAASKEGVAYTHSDDLATDPRWPLFGPAAADLGYVSVLSTALMPDARPPRMSGALNVFSRTPASLGDESARDRALVLSTHASLALAHTEAVRLADLREAHLRQALESRDVIGQAKGILMHRRGISADEAFDLLRRTSQELNVKLAELARTLAARHTELDLPNR
ncbi:MAG: ANTAR domain-containing protein [Kibdelosporangium sp.]